MKFKLNLKSVGSVSKSANSSVIAKSVLFALVVWLVVSILETILISGGLYAKGAPFTIFELIAVIVAMLVYMKRMDLNKKEVITSLVAIVISYAVFDFLLINLLLQKNDFAIYKFWAYYLKFVIILGLPLIWSKNPKISVPNLKLPLTKKS